mgnify:CR=1 FL=1
MRTVIFLALLVLSGASFAQDAVKPRPSPMATVSSRYKDTYIKVTYSQPHKHGRVIFGELVPYGQVWRTGANEATELTVTRDVKINSLDLKAGTYSLFTIPEKSSWTIILNKDLGFTKADRVQNIRCIGEVAKLMVDAGLIVLVSSISPFRAERRMVRDLMAHDEFFEIFIDTPLAEAEKRDPKGLYKNARAGKLKNFTGIDSPYEAPKNPDLRIDTLTTTAERAAELIVDKLQKSGHLSAPVGAGSE